jgi:hypothetical protein
MKNVYQQLYNSKIYIIKKILNNMIMNLKKLKKSFKLIIRTRKKRNVSTQADIHQNNNFFKNMILFFKKMKIKYNSVKKKTRKIIILICCLIHK